MDQDALLAFVDTIIPAGDGAYPMPSAAAVDAFRTMSADEYDTHWRARLTVVDQEAISRYGGGLAALTPAERTALIEELQRAEPPVIKALIVRTVSLYYMDDLVMTLVGMEARAPYPQGNTVPETDWSILDPVKQRGGTWRKA